MKLIWHEDPDAAVIRKRDELEKIKQTEGESVYYAVLREVIKTDPWYLMRVVFNWGWLDEDLVGRKFIRHIAQNWGKDTLTLLPRGHGKTLPFSAIVIISILNDPNIAILVVTRNEKNANNFGITVSDYLMGNSVLQRCFSRKHNPDKKGAKFVGFLPSPDSKVSAWGKDGYSLPWRNPRFDPTLLCIPAKAGKAGKHPDWIYLDDLTEEENNNPLEWEKTVQIIRGLEMTLPAHGFFNFTATRWHDSDPVGSIYRGHLEGKQGPFVILKESCYVDDDPNNPPTYPSKIRWDMTKETGYTHEALERKRRPKVLGGLGEFFDAQMRNDPSPIERADINVSHINIYEEDPKVSAVKLMGIETTGGGAVIYNGFVEWLEKLRITLPLVEISNPKKSGVEKRDRIVAALQPLVEAGKVYAKDWMIGDGASLEGLGYELRRLGKATHDDIADAFHNVPAHLAKGLRPLRQDSDADLYISVDVAWTEKKRSDWTVAMAVAVDFQGNHYVLDYRRFQINSPTGIYTELLEFYQQFDDKPKFKAGKPYAGAWR